MQVEIYQSRYLAFFEYLDVYFARIYTDLRKHDSSDEREREREKDRVGP